MSASAPPALADLRMACLAQEAALQKLHAWLSGATATSVGEAEREALEIASLLAAARRQPALPQPHSVFAAPPLPPPAAAAVASASRAIEAALRKQAAAAGAVLRRVQPRAGKRAEHSPPLLPPNEIVRLLPHQSLLGVEEDQLPLLAVPPQVLPVSLSRKIHRGPLPYQCILCMRNFAREEQLDTHMRLHARMNRPFQCSVPRCKHSFATYPELLDHESEPHDNVHPESTPPGKRSKSAEKLVPQIPRTRRLAAASDEVDWTDAMNCRCAYNTPKGQPCCVGTDCSCKVKGVLCVACGCKKTQCRNL